MWLGTFFRTDFSLLQVLKEGLLTVFMQSSGGYLTVLWTIHYEIVGSILAYIVSFIVLDNKKRSWIYVLLIIFFAKTYYVLFIFGVILADLYLNRKSIFERLNKPVISFVLIIMVIYLGGYPSGVIPTSGIYFWITKLPLGMEPYLACHFLAGLAVVLLVLSSKPCQKLLALKPFQKLGNISFSMYLLHVVVICSLSSYLFLNLYKYTNRYLISTGITFIVSLIVILLGSNYLEKLITKITGFFVNK
ncbi:MAG: acyltransferase family protein, partial [Bacilli bacterium]